MAWPDRLVVTCEHGGNRVPAAFQPAFRGKALLLRSHEGLDAGALVLARDVARTLRAPLHYSTTTRLLIDLNRSLEHPRLFSVATRGLPKETREKLVRRYWLPYRATATEQIQAALGRGRTVLHLSVHSFTPVFKGVRRTVDLGILHDPARPSETAFAGRWQEALARQLPGLEIRRNQPYRGTSDGFTTALRGTLPETRYLGLEIEVNQRFPKGAPTRWREVRRAICGTLGELLHGRPPALLP